MILVSALYNPEEPFFTKSFLSSAITVALCSLWPALVHTALGVASIDKDYLNVARVLKLGWWTKIWKIVLPSALPLIFTGLRLSLGVGWMVLIAAEMLSPRIPGLENLCGTCSKTDLPRRLLKSWSQCSRSAESVSSSMAPCSCSKNLSVTKKMSFDHSPIHPMSLLRLENVSKGYGVSFAAADVLADIDLAIQECEFVAVVGYSGSGKTTLLSLMAGMIQPDEGRVYYGLKPLLEPNPEIAVVFQNYSLLPWLSVYDNIALAVDKVFSSWAKCKCREHIYKYIAMVNVMEAKYKKPKELSGGMRQRVSVARALAMEPRMLLLDEPLSALDALTRANLQEELDRICQQEKRTVVLITNDVDEGIILADRIIPLSAGPNASLGPEIRIDIPRPRDRKELNHDPHYKRIRREIIDFLLGPGGKPSTAITRKLALPDIEPEDLTLRPSFFSPRRPARRRNELKEETLHIHS